MDTPPYNCSVDEDTRVEEGESGKLRQLLGILKKAIGVKDLASLRLTLPAHLLEPKGNLEYWCYIDRPDLFCAMADPEDELDRLIAVLRWAFSKELHFVKGRVCKPYNSVLGEQFRAICDVTPAHPTRFKVYHDTAPDHLDAALDRLSLANKSSTSLKTTSSLQPRGSSPAPTSIRSAKSSNTDTPRDPVRVAFINEQVSHHPPVSNFWLESEGGPDKGRVIACGVDQLSARFNGTSVKVFSGNQNKGIHVTLPDRSNEQYHISHPTAALSGFFSRQIVLTISDYSYITVTGGQRSRNLKAMINYVDESWIGKAKFAVEGLIYEDDEDEEWTRIKQVPESAIVARISGSWRGVVYIRRKGDSKDTVLVDLSALEVVEKVVRHEEKQGPMESRKFWKAVTEPLVAKDYAKANKQKQAIEQSQRNKAAELAKSGDEHIPIFFEQEVVDGRPVLTELGKQALEEEFRGHNY